MRLVQLLCDGDGTILTPAVAPPSSGSTLRISGASPVRAGNLPPPGLSDYCKGESSQWLSAAEAPSLYGSRLDRHRVSTVIQ